jgi:hypothetical protein
MGRGSRSGGSVTIEPNPPDKIDCVGVGIWTVESGGGEPKLVTRTCTDTPPTLSIHAPELLDFGKTATLSGSTLPGSSPTVLVSSRPCDRGASSRIAPVAGGTWLETVAPKVTTEYTVEAATDRLRATVGVRPVVTLRQTGRLAFQVMVKAARSFVGRSVLVELTSGKTGKAVVRRRLRLGSAGRSGTDVVTKGRFRLGASDVRPWTESVSVALPKGSTGPCLEPAVSDPIAVSQH